ncbi:MAG TPA: preprotein translocase subunit SecA [Candidatus Paceibacterota bacterium]|nr:preprotein translocase subunit SecA [Candidatus Paceibacterota bacterium]HRZ34696.1 preprotein translocase subunit SecA [Candidatus Paceibacterota bacterium]
MSFLSKIFGDGGRRLLKKYESKIPAINSFSEQISALSDEQLKAKTQFFRAELAKGKTLDDILPEAFAVVREAAVRTLKQRHYDVQLLGGMVIHDGNIAEMRTGEGKTLVATLPVYLNALTGKGVHVITVNDFLARRDTVWMGQIYNFLGLSVAVINQQASYVYDPSHTSEKQDEERDAFGFFHIIYDYLRPISRKEAYAADITYGTNSEFGFDYLRDNIEYDPENLRQREHNFAIVDEIDSILIDEARTPLIISAPSADAENLYGVFAKISRQLKKDEDYTVDEKTRSIGLTDSGISKSEKMLGVQNIYSEKGIKYVHHLETAVRAEALFRRDKDYVVRDGKIVIVDEFTGRMQPSRRWSEGLHQAIEAKEGIEVGQESRTFASITYQNYFKMYKKLSGMTGTAKTSAEEFFKVYRLETAVVPTNRPNARTDYNDLIYQTETGKFKALIKKIKELHEKGQPVLVGTVSIEKNELVSEYLTQNGIPHNILNAKNHEKEAEIISQAGKKGTVTIATNMAGRGVDIKLGGEPFDSQKYEEIKSLGGLFVVGTERHEARRIDNQLRGRSGRQGDPGETQFFVSLDDSLMRIFAPPTMKTLMSKLGLPEEEPIQNRMISRALENAQTKIEGFHFDARKHLLEFDSVLNTQRASVYERRRKVLLGNRETLEAEILEIIARGGEQIEKIIEEKKQTLGEDEWYKTLRRVVLQSIDTLWVDHLETMDYTRSSVNLRAYGQRDPLVEYRKEALRLFKSMREAIYEQIINILPNLGAGAFLKAEQKLRENVKAAQITSGARAESLGKQVSAGADSRFGRNDKVTLIKDGKEIQVKFKKAEEYLATGWKIK